MKKLHLGHWLVITIALVLVFPFALVSYSFYEVIGGFPGTYDEQNPVECGIIFGAAVHSVSDPGPAIIRRVNAGVSLYNKKLVSRLILTGGKGSEGQLSEAEVMRDVALEAAVPPDKLRIEPFSSSTWNNIRNSLPLLGNCTTSVAISDRYHLARIRLIGKKQGITLETFPADPPPFGKFELKSIARETIGYAYYLVMQ